MQTANAFALGIAIAPWEIRSKFQLTTGPNGVN